MNYYYNLLYFTILLNIPLLQSRIIKFKFEIYPINIASISKIKMFGIYNTVRIKLLSLNDLLFRLFTDDFYFN